MNLVAHDIVIRPIVTEKSSSLMGHNKYTFEVHKDANKIQIRQAVEHDQRQGQAQAYGRLYGEDPVLEESDCGTAGGATHRVLRGCLGLMRGSPERGR